MPFSFRDDLSTADIAFEAWGSTREELFVSSAAALLRTMVEASEEVVRQQEITILLDNEELDMLLFSFLQELIFYKDARRLLLHADTVLIEEQQGGFRLEAIAGGEEIDASRHRLLVDVKAVTLHRFNLICMDKLWKAVVVLDV
jgi:SHS2 domain-containing protein